ncbi:MAG TPA: helix-turn-helix domain-containing protein [Streptosporangiaceae bacterium]|jgi:DNA-binding transcriptional ArsR family regulator|nr:helix-turn-helix domain-containing protein [Streptosporangiaceae bacterium]
MALEDDPAERPGHPPAQGMREISDARTFRALSHPVRLALLETLAIEGPLTATEAGEKIGESPTTCSFHLRQLARYGFVEEAGGGKGRARPWRLATLAMQSANVHDDPETEIAATALAGLLRERQLERYRTWLGTKASYPREWRAAANEGDYLFWVTPEELTDLNRQLTEMLIQRASERLADPAARPAGALPVELLLLTYPVAPPPARN